MTKVSYVIPTSPINTKIADVTQKQAQQFFSSPPRQSNQDTFATSPFNNMFGGGTSAGNSFDESIDDKREYSHFQIRSPSSLNTSKTTPNKLIVGSPTQEPIGSPLNSPKTHSFQGPLNTPSTRRALNFNDDTPVKHITTSTDPNHPSPWTKSAMNQTTLSSLDNDELSPTNAPQLFSVYCAFPNLGINGSSNHQVDHEHLSSSLPSSFDHHHDSVFNTPNGNKSEVKHSNSLFSDSPPFAVKRTNSQPSVSFAPDPMQGTNNLYDPYTQYGMSQSYPLPQYMNGYNGHPNQHYYVPHHHQGMMHNGHAASAHHSHHQQQHVPSHHMMNSIHYDQQHSNWFDVQQYSSSYNPQQQHASTQQQQQPFGSPTRTVPVKSPKSKSYPSSPIKQNLLPPPKQPIPSQPLIQQQQLLTRQQQPSSTSTIRSIPSSSFESSQQQQPIVEGSRCRGLYKEFAKEVKDIEKQGYKPTRDYALKHIQQTPSSVHWRVYMDLADFAKRENLISEARKWFKKVNQLQPSASQGWLEHAKLEEECGRLEHCEHLLLQGLDHCPQNESLLVKAIKHFEQVQQVTQARALLSRLRTMSLDKSWKIMLEGALFESRCGNVHVSRKVFQYLMQHVSRHGPIYYEAYRLEDKCEEYELALDIVERGLDANPRYGPLWFAAFHLYEKQASLSASKSLHHVRHCLQRAIQNISKELVWKVHFEQAQIEERSGNIEESRKAYCKSVVASMPNLRWKVWLAGSRTELNQNNIATARALLNRALEEVPVKTRAVVLIECARLEEYTGDLKKARGFLKRAQHEAKHEWKVFLESILLEMRAGEHERAIHEAQRALKIHRGTGRLWAVLIQLKGCLEGPDAQLKVFREALDEVPKSGEVWCEGARIRLNPLSSQFNLDKARKYLDFAIKFTPQYGDSFIEYLRLELLTKGPCVVNHVDTCYMQQQELDHGIRLDIEQLCVNADPNYGPLWFHCKENVLDSTRQVLRRAKKLLMAELLEYRDLYQRAIMCNDSHLLPNAVTLASSHQSCKDFITGLHELNMTYKSECFDMSLRKKYIYGFEICV